MRGKDNGYPESHWELIIEEYDNLTGGEGGSDTKFQLSRHTELAVKLSVWHTALDTVILLAQKNGYAPKICANLAARFKPLTFSRETLEKDITIARSKLKAQETQIKEIADILKSTGEEKPNTTFFDDMLQAYREVTKAPTESKRDMTVAQFASLYNSLKRHIEQEQKNTQKDGEY